MTTFATRHSIPGRDGPVIGRGETTRGVRKKFPDPPHFQGEQATLGQPAGSVKNGRRLDPSRNHERRFTPSSVVVEIVRLPPTVNACLRNLARAIHPPRRQHTATRIGHPRRGVGPGSTCFRAPRMRVFLQSLMASTANRWNSARKSGPPANPCRATMNTVTNSRLGSTHACVPNAPPWP